MRELGLPAEIRFAAYNQVFQELLDPTGLLARNAGGAWSTQAATLRFTITAAWWQTWWFWAAPWAGF